MESYRFGMAWRAIGVTAVVLAVAFAVLTVSNNEPLDPPFTLMLLGLAAAGVWCYAYYARYLVMISTDGFTAHRLGRRPFEVAWRNVVSVRLRDSEILFCTTEGRKIAVSTHFPGYDALVNAAVRHLPDVVFESAGQRPLVVEEPTDPQVRPMQQQANQRFWLRTAARTVLFAMGLAIAAFMAGQALTHLDLRAMPRAVAVTLIFVLASVQSLGYTMSAVVAVLAVLFAIMYAQERLRSPRVPPSA